ncbi:hypothetical protein BaRGS_00034731, partial [Batillaria attramentaria]
SVVRLTAPYPRFNHRVTYKLLFSEDDFMHSLNDTRCRKETCGDRYTLSF